jgi:hypothetical protein
MMQKRQREAKKRGTRSPHLANLSRYIHELHWRLLALSSSRLLSPRPTFGCLRRRGSGTMQSGSNRVFL